MIFLVALALVVGALVQRRLSMEAPPVEPAVTPPSITHHTLLLGDQPVSQASAGEVLRVDARLGRAWMPVGGAQTELLLDVSAWAKGSEAPVDVALVLDQSSSMQGAKLEDAKAAARALIGRLRPGDRVALVGYGTAAEVKVPLVEVGAGRGRLLAAIDALDTTGATNISEGLTAGRAELTGGPNDDGRVRRIVLVSDGQATAGIRDSLGLGELTQGIRGAGVTVSALGLGADYNELSMTHIARQGGGNYRYISDSGQLASIFEGEMKGLTSAVARDAELVLTLGEGVRVVSVHGFAYEAKGGVVRIPLSEFASSESKSALVSLELDGRAEGTAPMVSVELLYKDLAKKRLERHEVKLSAAATSDPGKLALAEDAQVRERREQIQTAEVYERAMERFEQGQKDEAKRLLREQSIKLRTLHRDLGSPALAREADEADKVFQDLDALEAGSEGGRGFIKGNRARSFELQLRK
jgi:Ca-activated chloride channel family protein